MSTLKILENDGSEIVDSQSFTVYGDGFTIDNYIKDWKIIFKFNDKSEDAGVQVVPDNATKIIDVELKKFTNSLGMASIERVPIWTTSEKTEVSFGISVYSMKASNDTFVRNITITFFESRPKIENVGTAKVNGTQEDV
ncbi:MAG: hypothetical protein WA051_01285 [Minisyncoccia bacterium]